jgi:hypothetical protein
VGLQLNETHQLLAYADVNLLGNYVDTINKKTETLINAGKEVSLDINRKLSICCWLGTRM